jgi:hypothetical protein
MFDRLIHSPVVEQVAVGKGALLVNEVLRAVRRTGEDDDLPVVAPRSGYGVQFYDIVHSSHDIGGDVYVSVLLVPDGPQEPLSGEGTFKMEIGVLIYEKKDPGVFDNVLLAQCYANIDDLDRDNEKRDRFAQEVTQGYICARRTASSAPARIRGIYEAQQRMEKDRGIMKTICDRNLRFR